MIEDHAKLKVAFHETKITAAPMGAMVRNVLHWSEQGMSFENILKKLEEQVENTTAYILVDDLNHLVKGGRLSNGSAILGNILSIKPILHFNAEGKIVVFEKVRTEKKVMKRLVALAEDNREWSLASFIPMLLKRLRLLKVSWKLKGLLFHRWYPYVL